MKLSRRSSLSLSLSLCCVCGCLSLSLPLLRFVRVVISNEELFLLNFPRIFPFFPSVLSTQQHHVDDGSSSSFDFRPWQKRSERGRRGFKNDFWARKRTETTSVRVLGTVFGLERIQRRRRKRWKEKEEFRVFVDEGFVLSGRGRVPRSVWVCIVVVDDERTVSVLSVGDHSRVLFT